MVKHLLVLICCAATVSALAACSQASDSSAGGGQTAQGRDSQVSAPGDRCKDFPAPELIYSPNTSCSYDKSQSASAHIADIKTNEGMEKIVQWYQDTAKSNSWKAELLAPLTQGDDEAVVSMEKSPTRGSAIVKTVSSGAEIQVRLFPNAPY